MKTCKFCNAELPEDSSVCPACGKDNAQEQPAAPEAAEAPVPAAAEAGEESPKKSLSTGKTLLAIAAAAAVVILVAAILLDLRAGSTTQEPAPTEQVLAATEAASTETVPTEPPTIPADGNPDDVTCKGTYTADDETVVAARDKVVATAGAHELTLSRLQVYYWMEVRNFLSQYGAYASYIGLDLTQSLDTQLCPGAEVSQTWQQYFLSAALNSWHKYTAMAAEADLNGYQITELQRQALDNAAAELEEGALTNGFDSLEHLLRSSLGAAASLEDYHYFMEQYYKANGYYNQLAESVNPTDQELEAYFEEHADGYTASGITKDKKTVDVRHILIYPEGADGTNIFTEEFSEEAWAAGEAAAQAVLQEFQAGEQTVEAFAALANAKSQDPGSNQNGGLYQGVNEGEMVQAFNDWCFDPARQVGDTGIVKTEYGYHVMYFCGSETVWQQYVRSDLISEKTGAMVNEISEQSPLTVHYADILLALAELK